MAETIIRKSTACQPHGDGLQQNAIRKQKHSVRGPMKFMGAGKKSKRSRKY